VAVFFEKIMDIERHPLKPFLPEGAKVLFLGSFPPPRKRWCMEFYYPNFINDHWRILGEVFFKDRNHFVDVAEKRFRKEAIETFLREKGIAYYDTAEAVIRLKENASDAFLEVVEATDVRALLTHLPRCRALVTTGEKACATLCATFGIDTLLKPGTSTLLPGQLNAAGEAVRLWRLPSSSRAYPLAFEAKVEAYRLMFEEVFF
jgi:G:T/U-mismatch repair DNA glycosylase